MPLSAPRIAGIAGDRNAPERELSSFGLAEASPVGVFESNASRVFVDIRLDELIGTSGGVPVVYAAPGESEWQSVSLSSSGIAELERDVQFYLSAGIDVYLRFFIGSPVPGLTAPDAPEGLPGYAPDTGSPSAVSLWRALIAYFSAKFPEAGGIVLPGPVNDPDSAGGADPGDPAEWAERLARLCELTYGAAADANPDVFIVLPLLEDGGEGAVPPRLLTVMTARRIGEFGDIPWAVLSVSAMESAVPAAVQGTMTMLDSQSLGKPDTVLYLCRPSQSELDRGYLAYTAIPARERTDALSPAEFFAKEYLRFAEACGKQAHAVFVSLEDIVWRNDHDFYDMLKRMIGTGEGVFSAQAQSMPGFRSLSRAVIWDFAGSYHSSGWIPGGGALSCVSEPSPLFSDSRGAPSRILSVRFQQTGSGGVAGIVMRNLTPTADLSDVSALVFDFTLEAVGAEDGNGADTNRVAMVFVVGTDEKRAEFYADGIRCGEICSLGCDLTGWADRDRVDYIGIAVYADFDVSLKLERVTAGSRTAAPEEIGKIFSPVRETPQERPDESWLLPVFVIAAAAVFAVFVLLTRRDAEEADRKKQDGTYERSPR